jgi:hypothetical protein
MEEEIKYLKKQLFAWQIACWLEFLSFIFFLIGLLLKG